MKAGGHAITFSFVHTATEPGVSYCIAWVAGCHSREVGRQALLIR